VTTPYPKIELHVHLEGTVRAATLLEIAKRNDYPLPADTVEGLVDLYRFRDFRHFIEVWILTTNALKQEADYRQMVVDYAAEAASHGAVYLEGIFSPAERVRHGCTWEDVFEGVCNGAQEAKELHGVEIRLTPDIPRGFTQEEARETVEWSERYRDRGVVGVGLGGLEAEYPPEPYEEVFAYAKSLGLGSVPHAGEVAGAASVKGALENLQADRLRHGIRIEEDEGLVREAIGRGTVLDVCPLSNLRTGAVASLEQHPLPPCAARSRPTIRRCSTPTSRATTTLRPRSGSIRARSTRPASPARSATRRPRPDSAGSASPTTGTAVRLPAWRSRERRSRSARCTRSAKPASTGKTSSASTATC
jgi:aminodeoxyfutalosine deaminase